MYVQLRLGYTIYTADESLGLNDARRQRRRNKNSPHKTVIIVELVAIEIL